MKSTKKTYSVVTLGCRTNQYESQAFKDQLSAIGYTQADETDQPDICIVNTCTVTQSADSRSRYQIRQLSKNFPNAKIYVTGCLAQRRSKELKAMPNVSGVISNLDKHKLVKQIFPDENLPEFKIERFEAHTRAFVKIQDGCNSYCSYCIIPSVRGRSRSKPVKAILEEIKTLIANGYKEIVLTGINIGDFDGGASDGHPPARLSDLVRQVDQIEGLKRLRISSIDPDEVDDDLLQAVIQGKTTAPSMHIVLQAGSNSVLKLMNRKYTKQEFFESVAKLKGACSDFTFTTDVIVGFPGETEEDFVQTMDVIEKVKFAKVHMFPYSVRPKTRAAYMPNHLPSNVINERKTRLLHLAEKKAYDLRKQFIGTIRQVLLEDVDDTNNSMLTGHTDNFLQVKVPKKHLRPNEMIYVHLKENTPAGFIGCEVS